MLHRKDLFLANPKLIHFNQLGRDENEVMAFVVDYKKRHNAYPFITDKTTDVPTGPVMSLLYYAVKMKYGGLVNLLLMEGFPADLGIVDLTTEQYLTTPLMYACSEDLENIAVSLLDYGADPSSISPGGSTLLHLVRSERLCQLIMNYAANKSQLNSLINKKNQAGFTPFEEACKKGKAEVAMQLIQVQNFAAVYEKLGTALHQARQAYFLYPDQQKMFNQLCARLRPFCQQFIRTRNVQNNINHLSATSAYEEIFGKGTAPVFVDLSKAEALRFAIAQTYAIFNSSDAYNKYSEFLSMEFSRYLKETHNEFERLNPNSYHFKEVDGTSFPIPNGNFQPLNQSHVLKEFLITILKHHGLAKHAFKWIGFIPHDRANTMVKNGDFCVESRLGLGLFHNLLSHMIQLVLTIYMIENKAINLNYDDGNGIQKLTIEDILDGLANIPWRGNYNLWTPARDSRKLKRSALSDPYEMGAILMRSESELGDAMIDIFCRGLLELVKVFNESGKYEILTVETFTDKMNEFYMENFNLPDFLFQHDFAKSAQKCQDIETDSKSFAIVPKHYDANKLFQPKPCQLTDSTQGSHVSSYYYDQKN